MGFTVRMNNHFLLCLTIDSLPLLLVERVEQGNVLGTFLRAQKISLDPFTEP